MESYNFYYYYYYYYYLRADVMVCVEEDMLMILLEGNRYIDYLMLLYYLKFTESLLQYNGDRNFSDNSTEFFLLIVIADNDNEMWLKCDTYCTSNLVFYVVIFVIQIVC